MFMLYMKCFEKKKKLLYLFLLIIDNIYWVYGLFFEFIISKKVMCNNVIIIIFWKCVNIFDKLYIKIKYVFYLVFI